MPLLPSAPRSPDGPPSEPAPTSLPLPDELMSPEEIADRVRRRRRYILLPFLLLVLAGIAAAARPALHVAKAWQARRTAAQAENLVDQGKWIEARRKVIDAMQLWPSEPASSRAAARLLGRTGNLKEAASFWTRVEQARPLTQDEEWEFAQGLAFSRDFPLAEAHLRKAWPTGTPGSVRDWELAMQIAIGKGQASEAIELARRIVVDSSASARQKLKAASALVAANRPKIQKEGLMVLLGLSNEKDSPEALDALVILAQRAILQTDSAASEVSTTLPPVSALLERIEAHPRARIQHHLLVVDLRIAQDATRRASEIAEALERFGSAKDDGDLAIFAGWLYGKNEAARVLEIVPPSRVNDDAPLFFQRMDALAYLGRWAEVRQAIQDHKVAIDPVVEQMYLARCAEELREPRVRDARWDAALDAAGGKLEKLMQIGGYAQKTGNTAVAVRAYTAAMAAAPESREAAAALVGSYHASGDSLKTREMLDSLTKHWPNDPAIRNDLAYYDALLGVNLSAARDTARELTRADPSSLPHRVTLALAELRLGHRFAAVDAFNGVDVTRVAMLPPQRAVLAAALWGANDSSQARELARGLASASLMPEERALITPILDSETSEKPRFNE